jgi:hypothetical protein
MDASWIIVVKDQGKVIRTMISILLHWNVLSTYGAGMLKEVKTQLELYRTDTAAIQETRWRGIGVLDTGSSY